MKRKYLGLFVAFLCLVSCENKDDLLTKDLWILQSTITTTRSPEGRKNKYEYFNKEDEVKTLQFNEYGTVRTNGIGKLPIEVKWEWENEEKDGIRLAENISYFVIEVSDEEFSWSERRVSIEDTTVIEIYRHSSDKEWTTQYVKQMNESMNYQ